MRAQCLMFESYLSVRLELSIGQKCNAITMIKRKQRRWVVSFCQSRIAINGCSGKNLCPPDKMSLRSFRLESERLQRLDWSNTYVSLQSLLWQQEKELPFQLHWQQWHKTRIQCKEWAQRRHKSMSWLQTLQALLLTFLHSLPCIERRNKWCFLTHNRKSRIVWLKWVRCRRFLHWLGVEEETWPGLACGLRCLPISRMQHKYNWLTHAHHPNEGHSFLPQKLSHWTKPHYDPFSK